MPSTLHLSLSEFDSMVRAGAFDCIDRKVELIRGELIEMNPAGPVHDDLITYLTNWSAQNSQPTATLITSQTGLDLPEAQSRPEPDLMWLRAARYRQSHPRAADVQLAIEVADSSLVYDLETKRKLYAQCEIQEYWIVDVEANCVHAHRQPRGGDYRERFVRTAADTLSPIAEPTAVLQLSDLFMSASGEA
jgi:Uma2 family endonuclease